MTVREHSLLKTESRPLQFCIECARRVRINSMCLFPCSSSLYKKQEYTPTVFILRLAGALCSLSWNGQVASGAIRRARVQMRDEE